MTKSTVIDRAKALIVDPLKRIELDELINTQIRTAANALSLEHFPTTGIEVNSEQFVKRVTAYEAIIRNLQQLAILLARWGDSEHLLLLEKILLRLAEIDKGASGTVVWLRLSWYPLMPVMYTAGISSLSARRYEALRTILATPVPTGQIMPGEGDKPIVLSVMTAMTETVDAFKLLPGREREFVPRSEHLFTTLRPMLDEALLLGGSYDSLFDRFEMLLALAFADVRDPTGEHAWGPPGRFSWKNRRSDSPITRLIAEAREYGSNWPLLRVGFFGGQSERFLKIANAYKHLLDQSPRW